MTTANGAGRVPENVDVTPAIPLRAGTTEGVRPAAHFSCADQLPIRREYVDMIGLSFNHYLEIAQARVDDGNEIKTLKGCIDLLEGAFGRKQDEIERLDARCVDLIETIDRLRDDRRNLLSTLREIHEAAPAEEPGRYLHPLEEPEARGYDQAAWDAGEIARLGIEKVGATTSHDIPRRRAS